MNILRCIVIDDEPLARKGLSEYIADVDFLQLEGIYTSPLEAAGKIADGSVQLIFLDIQMPKLNGLDFLKSLKSPPPAIFVTAYPQHAIEGFELNALDYLVKPVSFDRFLRAALKAKEYYELRQQNDEQRDYFFIKADSKLVKVNYDDLLFVEALQNYVAIYTTSGKLVTYLTFKSVEEYLPAERFIKTHKSYIVAVSAIDHIEGNEIRIGSHRVPISRNLKDEVMARLLQGRFLKR